MTDLAFIFDVEGTLIDCVPHVLASWKQTLAAHGHDFSIETLHAYSGMDAKLMLGSLLPSISEKKIKALMNEQGKRYRREYIDKASALPGARDLFSWLKGNGHQIALATTSKPDELRHYLRLFHVTEFVNAAVCGDEVSHEKPAPDLIKAAAKKLPSAARRLIAIGDTPYDARAAKRANAAAVGVLTGGFARSDLLEAGCDVVGEDLLRLPKTLDNAFEVRTGKWKPDG